MDLIKVGSHARISLSDSFGDKKIAYFIRLHCQRHVTQTIKHEGLNPVLHA
jgi:hypothetical protein